jgi:hypothetical protein
MSLIFQPTAALLRLSVLVVLIDASHGFTSSGWGASSCRKPGSCLSALTERQMQFWEDVDEGLNDIEALYASSKSMDIDRVRQFAKR